MATTELVILGITIYIIGAITFLYMVLSPNEEEVFRDCGWNNKSMKYRTLVRLLAIMIWPVYFVILSISLIWHGIINLFNTTTK